MTSGFSSNLLYGYSTRENLALTLSAGFLGGKASSTVTSTGSEQRASSVVPILVGIRYYIADPGTEDFVRLFLSTAVGSFFGFEASSTMLRQEARSESTFGGKVGAGIDFFLSSHFKLVAAAAYNAMLDFKTPIGARANYNGGDFSVGFGYVF